MDKSKQKFLDRVKDSETMSSIGFGIVVVFFAGVMLFNYFKANRSSQVSPQAEATNSAEIAANSAINLPSTHVVAKGEDLWKIAQAYYQSGYNWVDIAKANNLTNPGSLMVGTMLAIPKVEAKKITVAAVEPKVVGPVTVSANVVPTSINSSEYTVVAGDSLWSIAVRSYGDGYAWARIYRANASIGANPSQLEIGTKLVIPR